MESTRTRKPTAQRRQEIASAILRIIGERGLTSLTTTSVAEEVGVTSGALFRHFASRDEMLEEAVRFALTRIEHTFPDPSLPPLERLLALARNRVRLLRSDPGVAWLLRSEQTYLALPEQAVQRLHDMVQRSARFLLVAIREGAAQGSIRDDIEPQLLLIPVMGTIHALAGMSGIHRLAPGRRRGEPERALSALRRLLAPSSGAEGEYRGEGKDEARSKADAQAKPGRRSDRNTTTKRRRKRRTNRHQ